MAISGVLAVAKRGGFSVARRAAERALGRFRAGIWPVVQTALAATLAWSAAALILGHEQPFVAAVAAVISIGAVAPDRHSSGPRNGSSGSPLGLRSRISSCSP